jgi:hypothetical protein
MPDCPTPLRATDAACAVRAVDEVVRDMDPAARPAPLADRRAGPQHPRIDPAASLSP